MFKEVTLPQGSKYIEQFERVQRWLNRLEPVAKGEVELESTDTCRDDLFAFFMNCYHLKDWIKNDPTVPNLKAHVERFINETPALSICADLCNGLKHLTLSSPRSDSDPKVRPETYRRLELGTDIKRIGTGFLVSTSTEPYDAFELAQSCVMYWELFLAKHGEPA